ncbi:MAG: GNAT family N-acetyltransferase, partial [Fibrobacter sp.]|nr:GNAT family N-acetyltransferase [Fibrobacter sp.]
PNTTKRGDAYALLAYAVRHRWGVEQLPVIAHTELGKPFFPGFPNYHFNLSHSGRFALCALDEQPLGADIECIRPHHPKLAQRICSAEELVWLEQQSNNHSALCQLWTGKEALAKYRGTGLSTPLRDLCPPLPPTGEQDGLLFHRITTADYALCVVYAEAAQFNTNEDPRLGSATLTTGRGDDILGYAVFHLMGPDSELLSIAANALHQRAGIGTALLNAGLAHLDFAKGDKMFLEVREGNTKARRFYEKHGFEPYAERKKYYADGENAILYQKSK